LAPQTSGAPTLIVNTDALNLRTQPSLTSNVITAALKGTSVQSTGVAINNWLQVNVNGLSGWMDMNYLASSTNAANSSTSATNSSTTLTAAAFGNPTLGTPAGPEAGLAVAVIPATTPGEFIWPVKDSRRITTLFKSYHQAIDIDQFPAGGNPAVATADGQVTFAGGDACCSYGIYVIIKHRDGFSSLYAHLSKLEVTQGQIVRQGQELGLTGNTGNSTGPHIHFAMYYNGLPFDPQSVLSGGDPEAGA
jgi:murein DD-endopeptidase MepM/ murein hydrolase activator NlpD